MPTSLRIGRAISVVVTATAVGVTTTVAAAAQPVPSSTTLPPARSATAAAVASAAWTVATSAKRVCATVSRRGPAQRPSGAKVVGTGTDLAKLVVRSRPGTKFWLTPGVHTLGGGAYDQVRPKDGDTFIGAPGAVLDGQHRNLYAFAGHAKNVTITTLTVQHFGRPGDNQDEGVVNHDAGSGWKVLRSTVQANAGAGVFLGNRSQVRASCLRGNGQYGFSAYRPHGVNRVVLKGNEIVGNNTDNWEARQPDCGCAGGGKFWDTHRARIQGNWVHGNRGVGLWADTNNTGFLFASNRIEDNTGVGLMYETSYNAAIMGNTFVRNGLSEGPTNPGFPTGAIYISESGSDPRVPGPYRKRFLIKGNTFIDNWSGVVAWENADRFAGSPANSSTGYSTLVNPRVATASACSNPQLIRRKPYFDDCRWKTQRLRVTHNRFVFNPQHIGASCSAKTACGYNGLFSNYGSYPNWSPYKGRVVEDHITHSQGNLWRKNHYSGPWRFMIYEAGNAVTWATWRSHRYGQDARSTRG